MKSFIRNTVVLFIALFVVIAGFTSTSAWYYYDSLSSSDKIKVKSTASKIYKRYNINLCETEYNSYVKKLSDYANYFSSNTRDYKFHKALSEKLKEKCSTSYNDYYYNNQNYHNNIVVRHNTIRNTSNTYVRGNCDNIGRTGCENSNYNNSYKRKKIIVRNNCDNLTNTGCNNYARYSNDYNKYYNCDRYRTGCDTYRNYKKWDYVSKSNGVEIRKSGYTRYFYYGDKLILTYSLSYGETTYFSISKLWYNNDVLVISKRNKYGSNIKYLYKKWNNSTSKITLDYISKVKVVNGKYYFIGTKNNTKALYKFDCYKIYKIKLNSYDNNYLYDYSVSKYNNTITWYYYCNGDKYTRTVRVY